MPVNLIRMDTMLTRLYNLQSVLEVFIVIDGDLQTTRARPNLQRQQEGPA
jgi:hypothetical protein